MPDLSALRCSSRSLGTLALVCGILCSTSNRSILCRSPLNNRDHRKHHRFLSETIKLKVSGFELTLGTRPSTMSHSASRSLSALPNALSWVVQCQESSDIAECQAHFPPFRLSSAILSILHWLWCHWMSLVNSHVTLMPLPLGWLSWTKLRAKPMVPMH